MSYILKALKRSESERSLGQAPEFRAVLESEPLPESRPKPWLLIGALLIANAFLLMGIFLYQRSAEEGEQTKEVGELPGGTKTPASAQVRPSQPPRQIDSISRTQKPTSPLPQRQLQTTEAPAPRIKAALPQLPTESKLPRQQVAVKPTPLPVDKPALAPAQNVVPKQGVKPKEQRTKAPAQARANAIAKTRQASRPLARKSDSRRTTPKKKVIRTKPALPPKVSPAVAQEPDPPSETVRSLPGILMSVHVYTKDPAKRFVYINGQRQREGDEIVDNRSTLEAIMEQGVIFDFGNRRVLLRVEK